MRIMVFPRTLRAKRKVRHGRVRPVIGNSSGYGITGAAVRAVDEWIEVSTVIWIVQFPKAIGTDRNIGGNKREGVTSGLVPAYLDREPGVSMDRERRDRNIADTG
jgi:hypothetical protein